MSRNPIKRRPALLLAGSLALALAGPVAAEPRSEAPVLRLAQRSDVAQQTLRMQQLEEQVRNLTGQVEGLQFQLTQMQTLIERMTEDNEFRFKQLEGGDAGKQSAATQPSEASAPGALPPTQPPTQPEQQPQQAQPEARPRAQQPQAQQPQASTPSDVPVAPDGERLAPDDATAEGAPMDDVGRSADPLIGHPEAGREAPLGNVPQGDVDAIEARPLDLNLRGSLEPTGDADAQYAAGRDAVLRGDYTFAQTQLSQFLELYPKDSRVADATSWLGEALIQLGSYDEAAEVLFTGFEKFPDGERAPDILLRLGVALAGANELETACQTFAEVQKRYPNQPAAFQDRLQQEAQRAQCRG